MTAKTWVVRPSDPKTVGEIVVCANEDLSAIDEGRVFIGKKRARSARDPVKPGDQVRIGKSDAAAADVPILTLQDDLVAVAKPAGIPTVPDHHGSSHSLPWQSAQCSRYSAYPRRRATGDTKRVSGTSMFR
jgi:23S rRNA-/tRNA-specific pseudouridylate synthase